MRRRTADREGLAGNLANLPGLTQDELRERWSSLFGIAPPFRLGKTLLVRAIAHRMQIRALGGLRPLTQRLLNRVADDPAASKITDIPSLKSGTRLLREWRGTVHEVIVLDDGVRFGGKRYRSLSEVATAITGAHWSGPRFFGLNSKGS